MPERYRSWLRSIDHLGAVCVILELKKRVQDQYWVNICEEGAPVLVMVEHTNFVSAQKYGKKHLVYLANYLHREDPRFKLSDKEVIKSYTSILKKMNPKFSSSWIQAWPFGTFCAPTSTAGCVLAGTFASSSSRH